MKTFLLFLAGIDITELIKAISPFAFIMSVIGLFFQRHQFNKVNKLAIKDRFVGSTARYTKIQEILLSNSSLSDLNVDICLTRLKREFPEKDDISMHAAETLPEAKKRLSELEGEDKLAEGKKLALCAMMFQLIEDVSTMHEFNEQKWWKDETERKVSEDFEGWRELFVDWMQTDKISKNWKLLKPHYSEKSIKLIESYGKESKSLS